MSEEKAVSNAGLEKLKEEMQNAEFFDTSIIKDNKLDFPVGEEHYRVIMPTQKQLADAEAIKYNEWVKLIQEENSITQKKLKLVLKKKDIDIDELEAEKEDLKTKLHDAYVSLATSKDEDENRIKKYKFDIFNIKQQYIKIFCDIETYLLPAIENRVDSLYSKTLACYCTEKFDEKKKIWKRMWKDYQEFEKDNSPVAFQACLNFGYLFKFNRGF